MLSSRTTSQPQRWALVHAMFMGILGLRLAQPLTLQSHQDKPDHR
jgi:hypothetical protein